MGAVATATAMALRVNGLSQYIMWESARLFENIGTVNDGMATLSKPQTILDKPNALPLKVSQGEIKFEHVDFSYEAGKPLLNGFNLTIHPGEKVGLIGRSARANRPSSTCFCASTNRKAARFRSMGKTSTA